MSREKCGAWPDCSCSRSRPACARPRRPRPLVNALNPPEPLSLSAVLASTVLTVLSWGTYGAALWMLSRGLLHDASLPLGTAVGAFTLGYILGLLALFAPGGVGVRELV